MEVARLPPVQAPQQEAASGVPPRLRSIPIFESLLGRKDVTHATAQVYGIIAAYTWRGLPIGYAEIAEITRDRSGKQKATRRRISRLEEAGLLQRHYDGSDGSMSVRFALLGPTIEPDDPAPLFDR